MASGKAKSRRSCPSRVCANQKNQGLSERWAGKHQDDLPRRTNLVRQRFPIAPSCPADGDFLFWTDIACGSIQRRLECSGELPRNAPRNDEMEVWRKNVACDSRQSSSLRGPKARGNPEGAKRPCGRTGKATSHRASLLTSLEGIGTVFPPL
jgi:hypothetical protein